MKTIQLSDEQLTVVLEAVRTRLMMGQFELEELRKMTNTVTTDALFYTKRRVADLAETLRCLEAQI